MPQWIKPTLPFLARHWPAELALSFQLPGAVRLFISALDWRGRYEVFTETLRGAGGTRTIIGYFLNPPALLYPAAFVCGLLLIYWDSRRNRLRNHATPVHSAATKPAAIKPPDSKASSIKFVPENVAPERLLSFFEDNTSIQAAELTKHYIGRSMRLDGTIVDVGVNGCISFEVPGLDKRTSILCYPEDDSNVFRIIKRGDMAAVIGTISHVSFKCLELRNCKLV